MQKLRALSLGGALLMTPCVCLAYAEEKASAPEKDGPSVTFKDQKLVEWTPNPVEEPAPVSTGGEGTTQYYGTSDTSAVPAWTAEATMNPDYNTAAAEPEAAPASTGGEGTTQYYGTSEAAAGKPWSAEAAMNPDYTAAAPADAQPVTAAEEEPAPVSTGGEGTTQFYGGEKPSSTPAWAVEAAMNPDYSAAPATAPAVGEAAIEACRDALNAEASAGKLQFKSSSWNVTSANYKVLDRIAQIAKDCGQVSIEVGGHTDSVGKPDSNKRISELRARAIVWYLKEAGVDANRLTAVGYGQEQPIGSNDTAEGRQQNRRIDFLVRPQ